MKLAKNKKPAAKDAGLSAVPVDPALLVPQLEAANRTLVEQIRDLEQKIRVAEYKVQAAYDVARINVGGTILGSLLAAAGAQNVNKAGCDKLRRLAIAQADEYCTLHQTMMRDKALAFEKREREIAAEQKGKPRTVLGPVGPPEAPQ